MFRLHELRKEKGRAPIILTPPWRHGKKIPFFLFSFFRRFSAAVEGRKFSRRPPQLAAKATCVVEAAAPLISCGSRSAGFRPLFRHQRARARTTGKNSSHRSATALPFFAGTFCLTASRRRIRLKESLQRVVPLNHTDWGRKVPSEEKEWAAFFSRPACARAWFAA